MPQYRVRYSLEFFLIFIDVKLPSDFIEPLDCSLSVSLGFGFCFWRPCGSLGLYVRLRIPIDGAIGPMSFRLSTPDGNSLPLGEIDIELIESAKNQAQASGLPFAGVIFHAVMQGFQLASTGGLLIEVLTCDDVQHQFAVLNIRPPMQA